MPARVVRWCLPIALALALLGVAGGFMLDDWFFVAATKFPGVDTFRFEFSFAAGDPALSRRLMDFGLYFWWTLPELELTFFRPLASLLIQLDLALFGTWAPGHHLHNALWYVATVAGARAVYRRLLPWQRSVEGQAVPGLAVGAIALTLFTLDPNHVLPAIWLSNRNSLICAALALAGLAVHLRARGVGDGLEPRVETGFLSGVWGERLVAPGLLLLALGGGETALGFVPYLVCFELFAGPGAWSRRVLALVPTLLVVGVYAVGRDLAGAGVYGSGVYLDPLGDPATFLAAAPERLAALLAARLLLVAADLWLLEPALRSFQVTAGVVGVGVWILLYRKVWQELAPSERQVVLWAAPATVLSLIPVLGTFPSGRLLLPSTLGGAALLAVLAAVGWRRGCPEKKGLAIWCRAVGILFWAGTVLAPAIWLFTAAVTIQRDEKMEQAALEAPIEGGIDADPVVVIGGGRESMLPMYMRWIRAGHDAPQPLYWWTLSTAPWPHALTRHDEQTLDVEVVGGEMLGTIYEQLVRDAAHPFAVGDQVTLTGLTITVLDVVDGRPKNIRFQFDRSIDDLQILAPDGPDAGRMVRVSAPSLGQRVVVGE